uniref:Uncharacterized protein n=1 Tax=Salix viminalis TaxID=40686 RepID=A0A6N2N5W8_SALVM
MAKSESDGDTRDPSHGENDQVTVDIDSLTSSVESMMSQNLIMSDKCSIFRVPPILRRHRESAYIPNAFSIGPWHRNHPLMKSTEKIKLKYLKNLLSRESESSVTLKELFESTREIEKEARSCYAGPIDVGVEDFVRLLVIDGCFLIELFRKDRDIHLQEDDDPIFNMSCMLQYLYHDLILNWLVKSSGNDEDVETGWEPIPSATDLVDAGIELKVSDSEHRSILDIKFNNGSLEMPSLLIQETTEVIFRNLISYEQCSPQCTDRITSYAVLLGNLINSTKDMDILTSSGIITNWLNPEEAMQFFNKLYHNAYLKKYYYLKLHREVNKYYRGRCPSWRALLMRNHFGTPLAIVSIFAAAALLILTLVQTIFTITK